MTGAKLFVRNAASLSASLAAPASGWGELYLLRSCWLPRLRIAPGVSGTWILKVVALGVILGVAASVFVPLKLERGTREEHRLTFAGVVIAVAITIFLVEFFILGSMSLVLRAKPEEFREFLDNLSVPIAFIDKGFLITAHSSFMELCGTILGNSFFIGAVWLLCYRIVRAGLNRGRVPRLNLSGTSSPDDDEE